MSQNINVVIAATICFILFVFLMAFFYAIYLWMIEQDANYWPFGIVALIVAITCVFIVLCRSNLRWVKIIADIAIVLLIIAIIFMSANSPGIAIAVLVAVFALLVLKDVSCAAGYIGCGNVLV